MQFFKNCHNINCKSKGYLIFLGLARLCVLDQIINTHNNKEQKSTFRSVRSDRNAYREKLDCRQVRTIPERKEV